MIFCVFCMYAVPISGVVIAAWWSVALLFGVPAPSPDQMTGAALGTFVLSQVLAAILVIWITIIED